MAWPASSALVSMAALRWGCSRYFDYSAAFGGPYPKTSGVDIPTVLLIHFERQFHLAFHALTVEERPSSCPLPASLMLSNALTLLHSMQHYVGEHLEKEQLRQMVKEDEEGASESLGGHPSRTQSACWSCGEVYGRGSPPISCGKCGAIQVRGCVNKFVCVCVVCAFHSGVYLHST